VLEESYHVDTSDAKSQSWNEYKDTPFDLVITVCDRARETCPVWPSQPIIAHWGSPDPAAFVGNEEDTLRHFKEVAMQINRRIDLMLALPIEKFEKYRIEYAADVQAIGKKP
jgi:protein-tyrosine-phosphatase